MRLDHNLGPNLNIGQRCLGNAWHTELGLLRDQHLHLAIPECVMSLTEFDAMVEFLITHYPEIPSHLSLMEIREAMCLDKSPP